VSLTTLILLVLRISIVLTVLALGLRATLADATLLFRRPRDLARAFLAMDVVMPLVALALALTFRLDPAVKIALVALSVSPVPPLLPKQAAQVGGEAYYAIGLLTATAVLAIVVVPAAMEIIRGIVGLPLHMAASEVAGLVLVTILLPLFAGIAVRRLAPSLAERAAKPVGIFAIVLLILSVLPVLVVSVRPILSLFRDGTLLSMVAFAAAGVIAGHLLGGPDPQNRRGLSLAAASRHPGMAVAIAHTNFPEQKLALPAVALYLIVSGILTTLLAKRSSRS
jgi:BASS family bile acid:Na+ symporter